jgi:hypothetical protein
MCKFITNWLCKEKPVKSYPTTIVSADEIRNILPPNCQVMLWDANYHVLKAKDAAEAMQECVFSMPSYHTDVFDCENFAMLEAARMAERYQINTCGIVIGWLNGGGHGFSIIIMEDEEGKLFYEIFEPQTGEFNPEGYTPALIIMG